MEMNILLELWRRVGMRGPAPEVRFRQMEQAECGLACVGMAAAIAGADIDLAALRDAFPLGPRGSTLAELVDAARLVGLSTRAVRCEADDVARLSLPAVLHWRGRHFVLLTRVRRGRTRVFDPAQGFRDLSEGELDAGFAGAALELGTTADLVRRPLRRPAARIMSLAEGGRFAVGVLGAALAQALLLAFPLAAGAALDRAAASRETAWLAWAALAAAALACARAAIAAASGVAFDLAAIGAEDQAARRLFAHMLRLPLPWHQRRRLLDVQGRFRAFDQMSRQWGELLAAVVWDGLLAGGALALAWGLSPRLAALAAAGVGLEAAVGVAFYGAASRRERAARRAAGAVRNEREEAFRIVQALKVFGREAGQEAAWGQRLGGWRTAAGSEKVCRRLVEATGQAVGSGAIILIAYVGVIERLEERSSWGGLAAALAYALLFRSASLRLLGRGLAWRQAAMQRLLVQDVLATPGAPASMDGERGSEAPAGHLELAGVSFRYGRSERLLLEGASLDVRPGEFVAIVGLEGAGKSTFLKVLCGLLAADGEIRIDGRPVADRGSDPTRPAFAAVLQDDRIFSGTIAANVAFFDEPADEARLWWSLGRACVDDEVRALPMRADTYLEDRGANLSAGQKQRILLARAIYARPRVLLLDESAFTFDAGMASRIADALAGLNMTRVVAARSPHLLRRADRVVQLAGGRLRAARLQPGGGWAAEDAARETRTGTE